MHDLSLKVSLISVQSIRGSALRQEADGCRPLTDTVAVAWGPLPSKNVGFAGAQSLNRR